MNGVLCRWTTEDINIPKLMEYEIRFATVKPPDGERRERRGIGRSGGTGRRDVVGDARE